MFSLSRFRDIVSFSFLFDQTLVQDKFQPLYAMASSLPHDQSRQEANSLFVFFVLKNVKNGRDVTRASHTSRLYPGSNLEIRPLNQCETCGSNDCVGCSFSHGVTWYKSRSLIGLWGQGQTSADMFFSPGGHVTYFMQIQCK